MRSIHLACVERLQAGLKYLTTGGIDLIVMDLSLPDSQGLHTFDQLRRQASTVPVAVVTNLDDETMVLEVMWRGAQDDLVKGQVDERLLVRVLRYAIERKRNEEALRLEKAQLAAGRAWTPKEVRSLKQRHDD